MSLQIVQFVNDQAEFFQDALSDDQIVWRKESQFAIQAFQGNDYLAKIAGQNPTSAQNAIVNLAALGVSLNPAAKEAYLVPRKGAICLDVSYMGLMRLAEKSGSIKCAHAKIVYQNDTYTNMGVFKEPSHVYSAFGDRGDPVGVYCTVTTPDGLFMTEEMDKAQVHEVRNRSEGWKSGKSSPWKTDELEMWKKTCVKRGSKYWPRTDRLDTAVNYLNTDGGEGIQTEPQVEVIVNPIESIKLHLKSKQQPEEKFFKWASGKAGKEIKSFDDLTEEQAQSIATAFGNTK